MFDFEDFVNDDESEKRKIMSLFEQGLLSYDVWEQLSKVFELEWGTATINDVNIELPALIVTIPSIKLEIVSRIKSHSLDYKNGVIPPLAISNPEKIIILLANNAVPWKRFTIYVAYKKMMMQQVPSILFNSLLTLHKMAGKDITLIVNGMKYDILDSVPITDIINVNKVLKHALKTIKPPENDIKKLYDAVKFIDDSEWWKLNLWNEAIHDMTNWSEIIEQISNKYGVSKDIVEEIIKGRKDKDALSNLVINKKIKIETLIQVINELNNNHIDTNTVE
jgi:hypothetical protein